MSEKQNLIVDAVYKGGRSGNAGDDPLHKLLGVSVQGGFRYLGNYKKTGVLDLLILTSSFSDPNWPDDIDIQTGIFTYYGDNKKPGRELHDTPRLGNLILKDLFDATHSCKRELIPPTLVFRNAGEYRDMIFLGIAVPGSAELSPMEDLVAIWKMIGNKRFQNYKARFTILNIPEVPYAWLEDIKSGKTISKHVPRTWAEWVKHGSYEPLKVEKSKEYRNKQEQLPQNKSEIEKIKIIHNYFKDKPTAFEACAALLARLMDKNFVSFDLTRPSRDGGRDAIGLYRIGCGESAISVDCALEAKCYSLDNSVGVREISRLISRLRHRQFGVLVTTSYLHSQAYKEIKEDGHPIIVISGRDIIEILSKDGKQSLVDIKSWLDNSFSLD